LLAVLLLLLAVVALSGCANDNNAANLQAELNRLQAELTTLQSEHNNLKTDFAALASSMGWDGANIYSDICTDQPEQANVAEHEAWYSAIEEFLMQFPTIFMDIVPTTGQGPFGGLEEGQFSLGWQEVNGQWQEITTYEVPDIYFNMDTWGYYDNNGNRFADDIPWLTRGRHAVSFQLFDFDNNGIPYILITSSTGDFDWYDFWPMTLYRFVDGEFRRVYGGDMYMDARHGGGTSIFPYSLFYFDPDGNLVGYGWRGLPGVGGTEGLFSQIDFSNSQTNINVMARERAEHDADWNRFFVWRNYITGEDNITWDDPRIVGWSVDTNIVVDLPGSNIRLTPILPMISLQEDIIGSVSQRLIEEGFISR